jgi:hypothetical protein
MARCLYPYVARQCAFDEWLDARTGKHLCRAPKITVQYRQSQRSICVQKRGVRGH